MKPFVINLFIVLLLAACGSKNDTILLDGGLSRDDLVKMDYHEKTMTYIGLSPESKRKLWEYKLRDNIRSPYLSRREKSAMRQELRLLDAGMFSDRMTRADSVKAEKMESLILNLGWSEEKRFIFVERFETVEELGVEDYLSTAGKENLIKYSSEEVMHFMNFFIFNTEIGEDGHYYMTITEKEATRQGIPRSIYRSIKSYLQNNTPSAEEINKEDLFCKIIQGK